MPPRTNIAEKLATAAEQGGQVRQVKLAFAEYLSARTAFVNTIVGLSGKNCTDPTLQALISSEVLASLCCPLIQDAAPGIRTTALIALSQLLTHHSALADAVVQSGSLGPVVTALSDPDPPVQAAAVKVLAAIAGACTSKDAQLENLHAMLSMGVADALSQHLNSSSLSVLEAAVSTIRAMIGGDPSLASSFCTDTTLQQLVVLLRAPSSSSATCRGILGTLSAFCSLGPEQALAAAQAGAIGAAARLLAGAGADTALAAAALTLLAHSCSHSTDLAYGTINAGALTHCLKALVSEEHPPLRAAAACLLLEVSRRSSDTAALVLQQPGAGAALVQHLRLQEQQAAEAAGGGGGKGSGASCSSSSSGGSGSRLAAVLAVGHLASFSANLAASLLHANVAVPLLACVDPCTSTTTTAASCGSIHSRQPTDRTRSSAPGTRATSAAAAGAGRGPGSVTSGAAGSLCNSTSCHPAGVGGDKGVAMGGSGWATSGSIAAGASSSRGGSGGDEVLAGAAAWALEQLGRHQAAAADQLATGGALLALTVAYNRMEASKCQQQQAKVKAAVKRLIRTTTNAGALLGLLQAATPLHLQRHVLQRLLPLLQDQPSARLECLTSGVLQQLPGLVQQAGSGTKLHSRLQEAVGQVLALYPGDVQDYYSLGVVPGHEELVVG